MNIKNSLSILFLCFMAVLVYNAAHDPASGGAPPSSTGAPNEQDCTQSGCHTDFTLNDGPGITTIEFGNNDTSYTPGVTYPVKVSIEQSGILRFGFEALILKDADDSNIGDIVLTQGDRTQTVTGSGALSSRVYVTYKAIGTNPISTGKGEWEFDWTAPSTDEGPVTFYIATIAADNDATQKGDIAYSKTLTIQSNKVSGIFESSKADTKPISIYPNPASDKISIALIDDIYYNSGGSLIEVYDINGRLIQSIVTPNFSILGINFPDYYELPFELDTWNKGIYFIKVSNGNSSYLSKLIVQ